MDKPKKNALLFIFFTLLIDVTGLGIIIPVIPKLIQQLTGGTLSDASFYGGWIMASYAIMQFICSPILGGLSDKYGRRPVLLFSLFGFGIDYLVMGFASNIIWLFLGRMIAGVTGASFTTATAYIADISTPEKRAQNFGMVGAAFGVGFIIGPMLGGLLGNYGEKHFSEFGLRLPFFASAGLALLNWLYGYFILPESLSKENRRSFDWKRANPVGSLLHLKRYPLILGLIACFILIYLAGNATQSTWTYYTMEKFKWDEEMVGYSLAFVGFVVGLVQGGLSRIIIPKIGERRAIYYGLVLYTIGFFCFSVATQSWMMFAFMIPFGLGGLAGPSLQSLISQQVPANEQGELQGALNSLISVTSIVGPLVMTNLFGFFTRNPKEVYFPGAPFLLASVLTLFALWVAYRSFKNVKSKTT